MGSKAQFYLDFLRDRGFEPRIDDDGDVVFQKEGMVYVLMAEEKDPRFFRLLMPAFWRVDSDVERSRALEAINEISLKFKIAKLAIVRERVVAMAEMWMDLERDLDKEFSRITSSLQVSIRQFYIRMIHGMEVEQNTSDV